MKLTAIVMGLFYLLSALPTDTRAAYPYNVTDLGMLPGVSGYPYSSVGTGINASGQVAGYSSTPGGLDAFRYSNGAMTDLGSLSSSNFSIATGISAGGQVVGWSIMSNGSTCHAFLSGGGPMTDLGTLGGADLSSRANGINTSGQIVGYSMTTGNVSHAFLYSGGAMTDLNSTLAPNSGWLLQEATAINDGGQIVGIGSYFGSYNHSFLYSAGGVTDLDADYRHESVPQAINSHGQVAGYALASGQKAFLYYDEAWTNLGTLGGSFSAAFGINGKGQVVGWSDWSGTVFSSDIHAFLYDNGTMTDLNNLIDPASGWKLYQANGINDAGQVVGWGYNSGGQQEAFLLTPTPEPSTIILLAIGAISLLAYTWRRKRTA